MRIFIYSLAGFPLLVLDGILLHALPVPVARLLGRNDLLVAAAGSLAYLLLHFLVRKPERMYVWGHEFAHLAAAKLFFRKVHQFHISSRQGGKVVMDGTNVIIDLAPYLIPLYVLSAALAALLFRGAAPWVPRAYLGAASFLFTMHVVFSAGGFLSGQPDVKRSGRLFSLGLVLLTTLLWVPVLSAPASGAGWAGTAAAYRDWFGAALGTSRRLLRYGLSLV